MEEEFKNYIYSKIDVEHEDKKIVGGKTPYELLDEAGYDLIECTTEKEIQEFRKYYASGEELCTFNGGRLSRCEVFFAVKKDVDKIKREDFKEPKREDEYGTSVMGIQFNREGMCTVSIKNRYNHRVNNPDATYGNDLDRITYGLEQSFADLLKQRGLELNNTNKEEFEIPGYTVAGDGKYYRYNAEINGIYYCPGNVIIENGQARQLEKNEELIDYFIVDSKSKKVRVYDTTIEDSFIDDLQDLDKIEITKDKEKGNDRRKITIYKKDEKRPVTISTDKNNQIIGYKNESLIEAKNEFLCHNTALEDLEVPNLKRVGDRFLYLNRKLKNVDFCSLEETGKDFLRYNNDIIEVDFRKLKKVGDNFLHENEGIIEANFPSLQKIGHGFLCENEGIVEANFPSLQETGNDFLRYNKGIIEANFPSLKKTGDDFLRENECITETDFRSLKETGHDFMYKNKVLAKADFPSLQ